MSTLLVFVLAEHQVFWFHGSRFFFSFQEHRPPVIEEFLESRG